MVTVRVTTLKGAGAGVYYVEQLPNYYLDSGEPRGIWFGEGARQLGVTGEVDDGAFLAVMAGMDPRRLDRDLGRCYDDGSARGFDVTASAPKSVSVLWALGNTHVRRVVLDAHDTAVRELAGWIQERAHTRYRIGGEVAVVDAEGIIAVAFRQHTSRALDPQLHTHLVIANRVKSPDGRWLALDARLIKRDQQTLSALYHAALRAELTAQLGVRWEDPVHGIAEIADIPAVLLAEFSTRTAAVTRRIDDKLDRFIATMGREPTVRERWRLEREAVTDSRPTKAHAVDAETLHDGWIAQTRTIGFEPVEVNAQAINQVAGRKALDRVATQSMIDTAIAAISDKQSSWRPTELLRELAALIPTDTAVPAALLVEWLNTLTDHVVANYCVDVSKPIDPHALLRKDGRPVTESVVDRALTTQAILDQEAALIDWVDRRLVYDGIDAPDATTRSGLDLSPAQAHSAAAVAGTADVVFVVGPAGTGKTAALAPAVAQLHAAGRSVFGVAPSATAAQVLSDETGLVADTLDKLLVEHRLKRPPERRYDLPAGTTVIVDEAGMMPTAKLAELADLADLKGWRVALVGDPLQFSAVGRGGMFGLLVETFGAIELERVHRFVNEWEREASLRLRRGDVNVADVYEAHDRLHSGTVNQMERAAVAAWWARRQTGTTSLLMSPTNEATERLNQRCQQTRIQSGEINPDGQHITIGIYTMYAGDEIATRHNNRRLTTDRGQMVRNRAVWTIDHIHSDNSLTATGNDGTIRLPAEYIAEHIELAYARTIMGAQGQTVQHAVSFYEKPTDVRNLYVAMTRGTTINEAFIATTGEQTATDVFAQSIATDWIDLPAHTRRSELRDEKPHRPGLLNDKQLRELFEQRYDITNTIEHAERTLQQMPAKRRWAERVKTNTQNTIIERNASYRRAQDVLANYDRPLHRRKHVTKIAQARFDIDQLPEAINIANNEFDMAVSSLEQLSEAETQATTTVRQHLTHKSKIDTINEQLNHDLRIRTRITRLEPPDTIINTIGMRPAPGPAARQWDTAAGRLAQHQTAYNITNGIGHQPKTFERNAYTTNRNDIEALIFPITQLTPGHEKRIGPRSIEL